MSGENKEIHHMNKLWIRAQIRYKSAFQRICSGRKEHLIPIHIALYWYVWTENPVSQDQASTGGGSGENFL
jgi:hypothetical protein